MAEPTYLTRKDAAQVCGVHRDTIRRAEKDGRLPNTRMAPDGSVQIAIADLVAAKFMDPITATGDVTELVGRSRTERDLVDARRELAVAQARNEELRERVARCDEQIARLCSLLRERKAA
jgi:DNA-binding XRE family transcriptional regulator